MSTIKGVWVFNELTADDYDGFRDVRVNFTSNGENFVAIEAWAQPIHYIRPDGTSDGVLIAGSSWHWADEAYRTVDFGEVEQEVPDDFYVWFTANATQLVNTSVYAIQKDTLEGIASAIREKTGTETKYTPAEMAQAIGAIEGGGGYTQEEMDQAVANATEAGKQAEQERFWDVYQQNGNRANYDRAFGGSGWTDEIFKPKHLIRPTSGSCSMYMSFGATCITRVDKTVLDLTSGAVKELQYSFYSSNVTVASLLFCEIDVRYITKFTSTYQGNAKIQTIILENINPNAVFDNNTFNGCSSLTNLTVTGTINSAINLSWSPLLTAESVDSVIVALADLTGQTAKKLTFHATVGVKLTSEQKATITAKNWTLVY